MQLMFIMRSEGGSTVYDVKRGDILISTKAHSCKVKFVEESDEEIGRADV